MIKTLKEVSRNAIIYLKFGLRYLVNLCLLLFKFKRIQKDFMMSEEGGNNS